VPYNLFRLFLVHKISAYKYIYENGKKKWEKKKEKGFLASRAGGDFGPAGRERARSRAGRWPTRPINVGDGRERRHGVDPHAREREGG
jgi:thymidylate synthase